MNIKEILKTVGTAALSTHPLGLAAIPLLNKFLPSDKQLNANSTGQQAVQFISELSGAQKAQIELAEIELAKTDIQGQTDRYIAMTKADGQETRAKIVDKAMNALIAISVLFMCAVAYVYATAGAAVAFSTEMAIVFATVSATFAYVVRAYFGDLKVETTSRHAAINNQLPKANGLAGVIEAVRRK